jgi:hypothetical protein
MEDVHGFVEVGGRVLDMMINFPLFEGLHGVVA